MHPNPNPNPNPNTNTSTNPCCVADGAAYALVEHISENNNQRCNKKDSGSAQLSVGSVVALSIEEEVLLTLSCIRSTIEQLRHTAIEQLVPRLDDNLRWRGKALSRELKRALTQMQKIEKGMNRIPTCGYNHVDC